MSNSLRTVTLDVKDALILPASHVERNKPYLPLPNHVETVLSGDLPPEDLTRTSFCLLFLPDASLLMANNVRRGAEIPGGHIDPGETMEVAARRESMEETGAELGDVRPIGFLRMISAGAVPPDYAYPHPVSFQVFHAAHVLHVTPYSANAECAEPLIVSPEEAMDENGPLSPSQRVFYAAGHALLFGQAPNFQPGAPR